MTVTVTQSNLGSNPNDLQAELEQDLNWAQSRPAVVKRANAAVEKGLNLAGNDWERALTDFEARSLAAYRSRFPGRAYSLTQNGANDHAMYSGEEVLHTIIRNCGLVWSDELGRGKQNCQNGSFVCFCFQISTLKGPHVQ